MVLKLEFDI